MTSPNRERAEEEAAHAVGRQWRVGTKGVERLVADKLEAAYDALSTALADRDRYKDTLDAAHKVFGAEITQMQGMVADTRGDALREASDRVCLSWQLVGSPAVASVVAKDILALITQPDRSAARQKVIAAMMKVKGIAMRQASADGYDLTLHFQPLEDANAFRDEFGKAVQELQSPNKDEGGK